MSRRTELEQDEPLYLAGDRVRPGVYRRIDGHIEVVLENEDFLPASLDGRVACYRRVYGTWEESEHTAVSAL